MIIKKYNIVIYKVYAYYTTMNLIIDNREKSVKEYFQNFENVSYQNLEIGDIQFYYKNELIVIIERKTIKDFISSLKDKRYKEQKIRMKMNINKDKMIYLIEGNLNDFKGDKIDGISKKIINSTFISLLIKDNIKIYQTNNLAETLEFILRIYKRLKDKPDNLIVKSEKDMKQEYSKCIKLKKKDNLTPEICYISQLSQIPGISNNIAFHIVKYYNSMAKLCQYYNENNLLLENFEYEISNGKKRKIGKKNNEIIYNFLFNK